tara:strand:- start:393 stop:569 length:177 start_codon:yes stop_codon:yes gene_type:complete
VLNGLGVRVPSPAQKTFTFVKVFYFSHHFYDKKDEGSPYMAIWNLEWINDWPKINLSF